MIPAGMPLLCFHNFHKREYKCPFDGAVPKGDQFREDRINEIDGRQMSAWKHPRKRHGFGQQPKINTDPL